MNLKLLLLDNPNLIYLRNGAMSQEDTLRMSRQLLYTRGLPYIRSNLFSLLPPFLTFLRTLLSLLSYIMLFLAKQLKVCKLREGSVEFHSAVPSPLPPQKPTFSQNPLMFCKLIQIIIMVRRDLLGDSTSLPSRWWQK